MKLKESLLSRRGFFTGLIYGGLASLGALVAYPAVRFLFHKKQVPLPEAVTVARTEIETIPPNSAVYFQYGYLPCILLKTGDGELRAFSAKCTHLDCNVQYQPESKRFYCACHDGYFDERGTNIAGPPPSPLLAFTIREENDTMLISLPASGSGEKSTA
jgi:cytochrome b6-f complex iron-sulfur subunit